MGFAYGAASVLLNTTAPGATTPSFATQQTFADRQWAGGGSGLMLTATEKPDLIVANYRQLLVRVGAAQHHRPGAGHQTPSFATQKTFATGSYPYSVTVADGNGDGMPDLIVGE